MKLTKTKMYSRRKYDSKTIHESTTQVRTHLDEVPSQHEVAVMDVRTWERT